MQSIRTAAELEVRVPLIELASPPLYQRIASKAVHLHELGMTYRAIADKLGVDVKTARKAIEWASSPEADR